MVFPFIIRARPVFGKGKGGGKPGKPSVIFHKISLPFLPGFPSGAGLEELIHSAKKAGVDVHISE